jgi:hypothetical protein
MDIIPTGCRTRMSRLVHGVTARVPM